MPRNSTLPSVVGLLAVLAVASCTDSPRTFAIAAPSLDVTGGPSVNAGGVQPGDPLVFVDRSTGLTHRYSFNAKRVNGTDPNSAIGQFQAEYHLDATHAIAIHGDVVCFGLDPVLDRARVGGFVRDGDLANQPAVWTVEDNGEGAAAMSDQASVMAIVATLDPYAHCALDDAQPTFAIQTGNVQIRR